MPAADVPDAAGDELIAPAVRLAQQWLQEASAATSRAQRRRDDQLHALMTDDASREFAMAFLDRVMRAPHNRVGAAQLRDLVQRRGAPPFLPRLDRMLLRNGARLSKRMPWLVMPLAKRRLRGLTDHLIVSADDPDLATHLGQRRQADVATNLNRLGEAILGEREATRRFESVLALIGRPDVTYVSVKVSAITSRINLWAFEESVEAIAGRLRELYRAGAKHHTFVNLDMEEYGEVDLTLASFCHVLDEAEFAGIDAGIVLQAYLPDSYSHLRDLQLWASRRHERAGGTIKVRIVKGANLAMERVDADIHGWTQAPYATKHEVDANWKRMVDWACTEDRTVAVRVGIASHNLFDIAWAKLVADRRGVSSRLDFEMLEGMAPQQSGAVHRAAGEMLLYTPIVGDQDFVSAISYLFRRLEENAAPDNFLRDLFSMRVGSQEWDAHREAFERSAADRWHVGEMPRRRQHRGLEDPTFEPDEPFRNEPDSDPALGHNRAWALAALENWTPPRAPRRVVTVDAIDRVVADAASRAAAWQRESTIQRRRRLTRVAEVIAARRGEIIATMAADGGKTIAQGDPEVSEAIDFARWYAASAAELDQLDGVRVQGRGVVVVTPPWNFPFAIPLGGVLAALAAGNAVILKPAPQTMLTGGLIADICRQAGIPDDLVQVVDCPEDEVGQRLVTHPDVATVVLTGGWETARLFASWRPDLDLVAETSGKNAMVITSRADVDGAVDDLVASAFGHGGQKCSAASLAIVEAELYDADAFKRQLADATRSLVVGAATDVATDIGPLIEPPGDDLTRGLQQLEDGEEWLVEPARLGTDDTRWRPGVRLGVTPGSWFHQTECFGPVLGVMRARNLDEAIDWQNDVAYGLTGGIWTLDPDQIAHWVSRVEVGNAYVNRPTTGAIVGRQPFGGWKRSTVGPGAKAGGPNYVAQLTAWMDEGRVEHRAEPSVAVLSFLDHVGEPLDPERRRWLLDAASSDAHWLRTHFALDHDWARLDAESNVFRYRPLERFTVRIDEDTPLDRLGRVVAAALAVGVPVDISATPGCVLPAGVAETPGVTVVRESETKLTGRLDVAMVRIRHLAPASDAFRAAALDASVHVADRPPIANGRLELTHLYREQSVSHTLHRYGNVLTAPTRPESSRT